MNCICLMVAGMMPLLLWGQLPPVCRAYDRAADSLILDSLRTAFGAHKTIPPDIELQTLRALSHYPELREVVIEFVWRKQKTAHSSQPQISTLMRSPLKRHYLVRISMAVPTPYIQGMQENLPYNAQIGVIGHELGHTLDYISQHSWGILALGVRYGTSRNYVIRMEHQTDQTTIDHNLGWQLLAWARIVRPLLEQAGRAQNYMHPEEIEAQL